MDYLGGGVVREVVSSVDGRGVRFRFDAQSLESGEDADAASALFGLRTERYAVLAAAKGKVRAWFEVIGYEPGIHLEIATGGRPLHDDHDPTHKNLERVLSFVYWAMRDASSIWGEGFGPLSSRQVWSDEKKLSKRSYCLEPGFGWVREAESGQFRRASEEDDVRSLGAFSFEVAANRFDVVGTDKMLRVPFPRGHRVWAFLSDGDDELEKLWRQRRCEELVSWVGGRATLEAIEDRMPARPKKLGHPQHVSVPIERAPAREPLPDSRKEQAPEPSIEEQPAIMPEVEREPVRESAREPEAELAPSRKPEAKAERKPEKPPKVKEPKAEKPPKVKEPKPEKPKKVKESKPERPPRDPLPWGKIGVGVAALLLITVLSWGGWQVLKPKPTSASDVAQLVLATDWLGEFASSAGDDGLDEIEGLDLAAEVDLARQAEVRDWPALVGIEGVASGADVGDGVPEAWSSPAAKKRIRDASETLASARLHIIDQMRPWQDEAQGLVQFVRVELGAAELATQLDGVVSGLEFNEADGSAAGLAADAWGQGRDIVQFATTLRGTWQSEDADTLLAGRGPQDVIRLAIADEVALGGLSETSLATVLAICKEVAIAEEASARGDLQEADWNAVQRRVSSSSIGSNAGNRLRTLVQGLAFVPEPVPVDPNRVAFDARVLRAREDVGTTVASWGTPLSELDEIVHQKWLDKVTALEAEHQSGPDLPAFERAVTQLTASIATVRESVDGDLQTLEASMTGLGDWAGLQQTIQIRRLGALQGLLVAEGIADAADFVGELSPAAARGFETWLGEVDRVLADLQLLQVGLGRLMLGSDAFDQAQDPQARMFATVARRLVNGRDSQRSDIAGILSGLGALSTAVVARAELVASLDGTGGQVDAGQTLADALEGQPGGGGPDLAVAHAAWRALGRGAAFPDGVRVARDLQTFIDAREKLDEGVGQADPLGLVWDRVQDQVWARGWKRWSEHTGSSLDNWLFGADAIVALHAQGANGVPAAVTEQIEINRAIQVAADGPEEGARDRAETLYSSLNRDDLSPDVTSDRDALRTLLDLETVEQSGFEFAAAMAIGWTMEPGLDEDVAVLRFGDTGPSLTFRRLPGAGVGGNAVFMCTTELSVDVVAQVLRQQPSGFDAVRSTWTGWANRESGGQAPRLIVWNLQGGNLAVVDNAVNGEQWSRLLTDVLLPEVQRDPSWGNHGADPAMPLQEISYGTSRDLCGWLIGGRLPTVGEFSQALSLEGVSAPLFRSDTRPSGADWNLRDAKFIAQRDHANLWESGGDTGGFFFDEEVYWKPEFNKGATATSWTGTGSIVGHDDGSALLDSVRNGPGVRFKHLVGNVAEWVSEGDPSDPQSARIIGASAFSDPDAGFDEPVTPRGGIRRSGTFDVGIRPVIEGTPRAGDTVKASESDILAELKAFTPWYKSD